MERTIIAEGLRELKGRKKMIILILIYVCGFISVWQADLLPNEIDLAIFIVSSVVLFLLALQAYEDTKKQKTIIKARENERIGILRDMDAWLADKSSHYDTFVMHPIKGFVDNLKNELIGYFREDPEAISGVEAAYGKIGNVGVKYRDIIIEFRYLLDPDTDMPKSDSFGSSISYEDKGYWRRGNWWDA